MSSKKPNRRDWSKINVKPELLDFLRMVARKEGFNPDDLHIFIFELVKRQYPETTEAALDWLGRDWLEEEGEGD